MLDVNKLVWSFRKTAGLSRPGKAYGGWEAPDSELRGHFVGHYLSASAQMWASTHNETLKKKMSAVVSALSACQMKMGTGYLSAFPSELFDRFEAIKPVWAPYYTIHKILAGLLDQYTLADNSQALKMVKWMVDYFYNRVRNVITNYSVERHYLSLNEETGGMNDVLYKLFSITADPKHLVLAHLFDKPCFLVACSTGSLWLSIVADDISGFHANTHIPVVVGAQMRYEITGDPLYKDIGAFFMDVVNSSHSYATGGTSVGEFWSDPKRLASTLQTENEESCTTYNMLKVSRHLFRWTKEMAYADYYERALTNGVLGIQRGTEPGAKTNHGWGTLYDSFWCCYGTGIESFSKLGDSIYFEEREAPGLYIIQYISSSLDWNLDRFCSIRKLILLFLRILIFGQASTLHLRMPIWTNSEGATATINSQSLPLPAPGSFLSVNRNGAASDKLTLQIPISLRTEAIKDDRHEYASIQAILYGPYLLAGHTSGDWNLKSGSGNSLSDSITPIPASYNGQLVSFSQESGNSTFVSPESGTDASLQATFRLIFKDSSSSKLSSVKDVIGKSVMLEPFDLPGMLLVQQGKDRSFAVTKSADDDGSSIFRVVSGVQNGCYVYSGVDYKSGQSMKLSCKSSDTGFNQGASFVMNKGLSQYHPISFVAKGDKRNYLLAPLYSLRDESYTIYFHIQP
ncbi:Alpha-L-arabinofuranosidase [Salix suchowensis]|nr:Alpha-L-arabinofuranosidase [Salix suchowensis]